MKVIHRVQIHQYNDPEILGFFIGHAVAYRLVGDHLFIIRSRGVDLAAGPGDWLIVAVDGEVEVERGDYALRARRAITRAKHARHERSRVVQEITRSSAGWGQRDGLTPTSAEPTATVRNSSPPAFIGT